MNLEASRRRQSLEGFVGLAVGTAVLATTISPPFTLVIGTLLLSVGASVFVSRTYGNGPTSLEPAAVFLLAIVLGAAVFTIIYLAATEGVPFPRMLGVVQSIGESVFNVLVFFAVPALLAINVVDVVVDRLNER